MSMDMDSKLDAYLLSKCTLSLMKTSDDHSDRKKLQRTSPIEAGIRPQKYGEIFYNKGNFFFTCTHCGIVCKNCQEIMDHIVSHFDKETSFTHQNNEISDSPFILPEFVSTGKLKPGTSLETTITPTDIIPRHSNVSSQPTSIMKTGDLKPKFQMSVSGECGLNDLETKYKVDESKPLKKTPIVRIVKLRPVKLRRRVRTSNVDLKNVLSKLEDLPITKTPSEVKSIRSQGELEPADESDTKSNNSMHSKEFNHIEPKKQIYVRNRNRFKCYQCEMEPIIWDPSDPRRHTCLFCTRRFPNHIEFETHVKEIHNKDANLVSCKDFYCYLCEKKFAFRQYLTSHLKVHNENPAHLCATCGLRFKTGSSLTLHMKIHDGRTYECDQCGKVFKHFDRLRKHFWCHNTDLSFVCKVCSKAFKMKKYLKSHAAIHNEPKFNCRHCDANFHFVSVRRAHEKRRHNVM